MFDIHTHVLPAIDDGPQTVEEALDIIGTLVHEGITNIVATPHYNDSYPHVSASEVRERVEILQRVVHEKGLKVHLWPGHEVSLDADTQEALTSRNASTINGGPYVLLELSKHEFPIFIGSIVSRLCANGFFPVIAHAERYLPVLHDPEVLVPLVEAGAVLQITASSFVGFFGQKVRQTAEVLMRRNLAHVIASDAHAVAVRAPRFVEGLRAAEQIVGSQRVREMVLYVPQAIVQGKSISVPPIIQSSTRYWRRLWLPGHRF